MKIPYANLGLQNTLLQDELLPAICNLLQSGQFILGEEVQKFERNFAECVNARYAISVNSGTDALLLTMIALGIVPGDEVVTVPNSFLATVAAIELVGATPVLVDVDEDQNIDVTQLEAGITPRTRAIIPVHLTGRPARMEAIMEIASRRKLLVIEDCAQAVNASLGGKQVGTFGLAGTFSLHPLKNLAACGDGGIVVTNDGELAAKLSRIRNHGLINRDECIQWGHNSRLDALQAAILNVKLCHLERWTQRRRDIAHEYCRRLQHLPLLLPLEELDQVCVYHAFVIQVEDRNELQRHFSELGIETKVHYPIPIHMQTAAKHTTYGKMSFPVAERQARHILSLPIYPELTDKQVEQIIVVCEDYFDKRKVGHYICN